MIREGILVLLKDFFVGYGVWNMLQKWTTESLPANLFQTFTLFTLWNASHFCVDRTIRLLASIISDKIIDQPAEFSKHDQLVHASFPFEQAIARASKGRLFCIYTSWMYGLGTSIHATRQ